MGGTKKNMAKMNVIQCGQGAPSLFLIILAGQGKIEADIVIWADTGSENDLVLNDGSHVTGSEYFELVTKPLAEDYGLQAYAVKREEPLHETQKLNGSISLDIPVFGSKGGKLKQSCTSKVKVSPSDLFLKSLGMNPRFDFVTKLFGITMEEKHRVKRSPKRWQRFKYPLVDLGIYRQQCEEELDNRNIPYLLSTQCDCCPHQDAVRWLRHTPKTIQQLTELEASWNGSFFLTKYLEPLSVALEIMREDVERGTAQIDFMACDNGECFV